MPFFDFPLEVLQTYRPEREEMPDFDNFWRDTLAEARKHPLNAQFVPTDSGLRMFDTYDVTFAGYGGQPIKGWFIVPHGASGKLPCTVEYIGYGGGRNFPTATCSTPQQATRRWSWIRAVRAAAGRMATRRIFRMVRTLPTPAS